MKGVVIGAGVTGVSSRFGRVAVAGHAATAREEMRGLARDLLALAGPGAGPDLRALLEII